jgi:hypothetical protein
MAFFAGGQYNEPFDIIDIYMLPVGLNESLRIPDVIIQTDYQNKQIKITIKQEQKARNLRLNIFCTNGKLIMARDLDGNSVNISFNDIAKGLYVINLSNEKVNVSKKFIFY